MTRRRRRRMLGFGETGPVGEMGPVEVHHHAPGELEAALERLRRAPHYYAAPTESGGRCGRPGCGRPASDPVHLEPLGKRGDL